MLDDEGTTMPFSALAVLGLQESTVDNPGRPFIRDVLNAGRVSMSGFVPVAASSAHAFCWRICHAGEAVHDSGRLLTTGVARRPRFLRRLRRW